MRSDELDLVNRTRQANQSREVSPEIEERNQSPEPEITSTHEGTAPEDFGVLENLKEGVNAVAGGGIDAINSVGSIPKFFDPKFYQQDDPEDPYKFNAPWIINRKPITRTRWGGFVRSATEIAAGLVGTGKVMWGIKGARGLITAAKATRMGRVGLGAVQGGIYDVISNQSQEQNLAASLIDIKPQWKEALTPFATTEDMSPAQRAIYNFGEGLGLGGMFDLAGEALGIGSREIAQRHRQFT